MNKEGKLKPEFICYSLRTLMSNCADFKEEKSAMEVLLQELSSKSYNNQKIDLLVSPKYHCELVGEGVVYAWGVMKRYFRSLSLDKNNTKVKFDKVVRKTVEFVSQQNTEIFSARCRRYKMAYSYLNKNNQLTYAIINRFVKVSKMH